MKKCLAPIAVDPDSYREKRKAGLATKNSKASF
jgi:hypothetical protein